MALEKVGNLGQVQLMQRFLAERAMEQEGKLILNKEEVKELDQMLSDFQYVLSNLMMWENTLKNDQYGGLTKVIEDIKAKDLY